MKRSLWLLALLTGLLGCSSTDDAGSAVPPIETGIQPTCISPCTTRYEVRLPSTVTNGTFRSTADVTTLVLDAMRARLATRSDIDVDEGSDPTTTIGAYRLEAAVPTLVYSAGNLSTTVRLYIYRYWGGALVGEVSYSVTAVDVRPSRSIEDKVISAAASAATQNFMNTLP